MTKRVCKTYDAKLKAKVALEAVIAKKELIEISTNYNIPKSTIIEWRDKLINEAVEVFIPAYERDKKNKQLKESIEDMQRIIGEVTIEKSFLKKKLQK